MPRSKLYTVQPIPGQDQTQAVNSTSVFASGPLQAARMVLGTKVTTRGHQDSLCGRVWELREDLTPTCTDLFRSTEKVVPTGAGSRMALISTNIGEWIVVLKILMVCAIVIAIGCFVVMNYGA